MRYHVLACDYDDTLATRGRVHEHTVRVLERVSRSGRKLLLVTGRELDDLLSVFPHADLFDLVVAENGGLLYDPGERTREPLAEAPPAELVDRLRAAGVTPLGVGSVVVATREPYDAQVHEVIRELGLELQVIRNKGAVMVLPPGVNKASGLAAALDRLCLSRHNVVAVGDAENDHAFLSAAECGAAVANAVPALLRQCDLPLGREAGHGVVQLAELLLSGELDQIDVPRHDVLLGHGDQGEARLTPYGTGLVVAGPSGSGKSTVTTALLERLVESDHQCVVIDPEGDYAEFPGTAVLGEPDRAPAVDEVLRLLESPRHSAVVNMIGMPLRDRPAFFAELVPRLVSMRAKLGHPHWVVVDEAHHLMPAEVQEVPVKDVRDLGAMVLITVHPEALSPAALNLVDGVIAVGPEPGDTLGAFADALGRPAPAIEGEGDDGSVVLWRTALDAAQRVQPSPARAERTRHRRKYAAGTMSKDKSFYFTGPEQRLNLRARNLHTFVELAEGIDGDTWAYHLKRGDYSAWIRDRLGDDELAGEVEAVERDEPDDSLSRVVELIDRRYTLPAEPTRYDPDHDD
ncbi:HAD-IIB family hydrolase [Nonomuraea sp. SBT364]|uniref:HAD-IIB family hydrolase n=1 Tax=Nonomuraea sp. SBT364 TaxID=1580530 RepID=UPI00066EE189|nr:HAD-IIB family hydrolase [Nonomuraea sp. SBT364]